MSDAHETFANRLRHLTTNHVVPVFDVRRNAVRNVVQPMTQVELAEHLNISRQQVSNYVNGKSEPLLNTLAAIATCFDVSVDYLLGRA